MVNNVGFLISEEDTGPGTGLDHSRAFVYQSFVKVRKGTDKASDIDIRGGWRAPPSLVLARELYTFLISHYNTSNECLKVVKILPDPLPQFIL